MVLLLVSVGPALWSQDLSGRLAGEHLQACSDRTLYVSGERIFFSVFGSNGNPEAISRIFYCELITPDGNRIAGGKYLLENAAGHGSLLVPEDATTGIYYLKFYTRAMRNGSTDAYTYILLKIVNPYRTDVLQGKDAFDSSGLAAKNGMMNGGGLPVTILSDKKSYSERETIRLNLQSDTTKGMPGLLCLSVIPGTAYTEWVIPHKNNAGNDKPGAYLPETRGVSLSGQVTAKGSGVLLPGCRVNLSIIGDKDIQVKRADASGRFIFALPDYHGKRDIFLCAGEQPGVTPEILIDNDFCSRPVSLPSPRFGLNERELKTAYKLAVNFRLTTLFREDSVSSDTSSEENHVSFYGKPSKVLALDKYIELPTLGDYFSELAALVKVKKIDGKRHFRFYTTETEAPIDVDPLMLVDWVAVDDINKILALSPQEIDRIELVNAPYVKGGITFGGIISFVSKKYDFAGIDLPASGTFVNYSFLEPRSEFQQPGPLPDNTPDSRNTLIWNPALQLSNQGSATVTFPAPDTPGTYTILLRGMNEKGETVMTTEVFEVTGK